MCGVVLLLGGLMDMVSWFNLIGYVLGDYCLGILVCVVE